MRSSIYNSLKLFTIGIFASSFSLGLSLIASIIIMSVSMASFIVLAILEALYFRRMEGLVRNESSVQHRESLVDDFMSQVMEYCYSIGLNPSLIAEEDGTMVLADYNEETGSPTKIMNLEMPDNKRLTRKNFSLYLETTKEKINEFKSQLKK